MRYAKLINDCPSYAPRRMLIGNAWVYNPTDAQLESMETVGLPPIDKDERALIFDATSSLIASFEKSAP